jgi:predicted Rossmann-fold nucleotide-binding protein
MIEFLDHAVAERFVRPEHRKMLVIEEDPVRLIDRLVEYRAVILEKWVK